MAASAEGNPDVERFDCAVFTGEYVTGDVDQTYLDHLDKARNDAVKASVSKSIDSGENAVIGLHNDMSEAG